jgi:bifunctional UDP-N-acetylglucosamine pyrophosphorylase/glucosamine-1-phosphate N-acetyltransferase
MSQTPRATDRSPSTRARTAVVLAAGKGTRLRSALPKVLHRAGGRPLLGWVLAAAREAGCERLLTIVGHGADEVRERIGGEGSAAAGDVVWVHQEQQLGTGHALAQVEPHAAGDAVLLVLSGDVPLVRPATLERLLQAAESGWGAMAVAELADPGALGRVMAGPGGRLERIVEAADATPEELECRRVNAGIYALPAPEIFPYLHALDADNAKGEYYLTDALTAAAADGRRLTLVSLDDPSEAYGVNDRVDLARAHRTLLERRAEELMRAGVTLLDPATTTVEPGVRVGEDTVIHPGVSLLGHTRVGGGCELHQGAWLRDAELGDGVVVEPYSLLDGARVAGGCHVGPFARLRPASVLLPGAKVGNFVELKKTTLGEGSKANHLAYLGDATVGAGANVGAGTITCNYDGVAKHATEIGDGAFIGSDTMLVAPVTVGRGATTGAGSVITQDVPEGALAVGRARQRNIADWERRPRKPKKT